MIGRPVAAWKDWHHSADFRVVRHEPDVVQMLRHHGGAAVSGMTAAETYDAQTPILEDLGNPIPGKILGEIGDLASRYWGRKGINARTSDSAVCEIPIGLVIAATITSLASRGHRLRSGHGVGAGCTLTAQMRSSAWSNGGDIEITIAPSADLIRIDAATVSTGQFSDTGHGKRVLEDLLNDIPDLVSLMP